MIVGDPGLGINEMNTSVVMMYTILTSEREFFLM